MHILAIFCRNGYLKVNKWKFLLVIVVTIFVAYWIGHQGHVGLSSYLSAMD